MKKSPFLTKAFQYQVFGYSIMPLRRNKRPALNSWTALQETPWTDEEVIAYWEKNQSANIGIITGKISGITVVDIDTGKFEGDPTTALSAFPATYTVKTPTGGYHLYYKYDARIQQTANTFPQFPHVDIRNDGGYVVAPPSHCDYVKNKKRTTGDYVALDENAPIAPFPIELFGGSTKKSSKQSVATTVKSIEHMAEGAGRNNALTQVIGKLVQVTDPEDYGTVVWTTAIALNSRFAEPLEEREVRTIFDSIVKRESKKAAPEKRMDLLKGDKGAPIVNVENIVRVLESDPKCADSIRFNIFTGFVQSSFERYDKDGVRYFDTYQKVDTIAFVTYLSRVYPFLAKVRNDLVEDAIVRIAYRNKVSPPVEWLSNLVWDKAPRLDSWISKTYGTPEDEYHKAVASNWMKGLVRRIVEPGSKFDYVLVVEGKQGIRKSTSLAVLGGDWYVETVLAPDNKDFFMLFGGKAIVEFSEGETLSRTEAKRMKAIITITNDKYRVPYERAPQEFPRQCVFAMTTNQSEYLKDETGNRRWLPIKCEGMADIDWLTENREQMYAEAYHRAITLRETVHEFPAEETEAQQQMRQTADPREEAIYDWYFLRLNDTQRGEGITAAQAFEQGVHRGVPFGREMSRFDQMVIGSILTETLKLDKHRTMDRGNRYYKYFPSMATDKMAPTKLSAAEEAEKMFADYTPQ